MGKPRTSVLVSVLAVGWIGAVIALATIDERVSAATRSLAPTVPPVLQAPQNIAPAGCTTGKCHAKEKDWSITLDGDGKPKGRQHLNALNQLSVRQYPNVKKYADAIGVKDVFDAKSACVRCHATVVQGSADDGITCQSCHGPGSLYNAPHQEEGAYAKGVALPGMVRYIDRPEVWAPICVGCHVLGTTSANSEIDAKLVAAGHWSGIGEDMDFALSKKFERISPHWKNPKKYTVNQIAVFDSLGRPRPAPPVVASAPPPPPTVVPPAPQPAPTPVPTPAASAPAVVAPTTPAPSPVVPGTPPAVPSASPAESKPTASAPAVATPAPPLPAPGAPPPAIRKPTSSNPSPAATARPSAPTPAPPASPRPAVRPPEPPVGPMSADIRPPAPGAAGAPSEVPPPPPPPAMPAPATVAPVEAQTPATLVDDNSTWVWGAGAGALLIAAGAWLWRRRHS